MARRRPFARFDTAQQDSNQTLSSYPRLPRSTRPMASMGSASAARETFRRSASRRRPHQASAFFLETTDDDERSLADRNACVCLPALCRSMLGRGTYACCRTQAIPAADRRSTRRTPDDAVSSRRDSFARQYPRVHIGAIDFPATRSVLWYGRLTWAGNISWRLTGFFVAYRDRRVLADTVVVSSTQMLPRFVLPAAVARDLYSRHQLAAAAGATDAPACFVRGEAIVPTERRVKLAQVVNDKVWGWCRLMRTHLR